MDLQGEAVGHAFAVYLDRGVRGREHRGVLQQLRDQVGEVGDGRAAHPDAGQPPDLDPLVVLHFGDRRPHHVHQLDRLAPLPGRGRPGQDHQALRVAAHAGGEVVEAEEVRELVAVLRAPFHGVQERQLTVQEHLVAAREVDEDLGDAASHVRLFDGGLDRGPLQGVEGLSHLADLVALVTEGRRFGLHVDLLPRCQSAHHARQPDPGHLVGVLAQPGKVADEFAAHAYGDEDGHQQGDESQDACDTRLDQDAVAGGFRAVLEAVGHLGAVVGQALQDGRRHFLPPCGVHGARLRDRTGGDELLLGRAQGLGLGAAPVLLHAPALALRQELEVDLVQELAAGGEVGDDAEFGGPEPSRDEARRDQGILAREHFAGPGDTDEGPDLLVHRYVLHRVETVQEAVTRVDETVVEAEGPGPVDGALLDGPAQRVQAVDLVEDGIEQCLRLGAELFPDVLALRALPDFGHDPVGSGTLAAQQGKGVRGPGVGEEDEGLAAFALDGADGVFQGMADLLHDGARAHQFVCLTAGVVGGEHPQTGEGGERHQEQRHDLPADGLPAKAHGLPQLGPASRGWLCRCSGRSGRPAILIVRVLLRGLPDVGRSSLSKRREPTTDLPVTRRRVRTNSGRSGLTCSLVVLVFPAMNFAKATEGPWPNAMHPHRAVGWNLPFRDLSGPVETLGRESSRPGVRPHVRGRRTSRGYVRQAGGSVRVERAQAGQPPLSRTVVGS